MPKSRDNPDAMWISTRQVADLLGVSIEQVRRLSRSGELPSIKIGKSLRFRRSIIENLDKLEPDS